MIFFDTLDGATGSCWVRWQCRGRGHCRSVVRVSLSCHSVDKCMSDQKHVVFPAANRFLKQIDVAFVRMKLFSRFGPVGVVIGSVLGGFAGSKVGGKIAGAISLLKGMTKKEVSTCRGAAEAFYLQAIKSHSLVL